MGYAQSGPMRFERLSVKEGLSQSSVLCITQDVHGFMWLGTYEGLNRYDGYAMKIFQHDLQNEMSISNNVIKAVLLARDSSLWVATERGLNRYDRHHESFRRYFHQADNPHSLSHDRIRALIEDHEGNLWIGAEQGLNRYDAENDRFVRYCMDADDPYTLSDNRIRSFLVDRNHDLWIGTDNGLNRYVGDEDRFDRYTHSPDRSDSSANVIAMCEDRSGKFWVGTWGQGVFWFDRGTGKFTRAFSHSDEPNGLTSKIIRSIFEDSDGLIWLGSYGGGLFQWNPNKQRLIHATHKHSDISSIGSDAVNTIFQDRSGIIWVGAEFGGANLYDPKKNQFQNFKSDPALPLSLPASKINALYEDPGHQGEILWIGTWGGGLVRFNRKSETCNVFRSHPDHPDSLSNDVVRCMLKDHQGILWVGTDGGLNAFYPHTREFHTYPFVKRNSDMPEYNNVFYLLEDSKKRLWACSYYGGLNRFDRDKKRFIQYIPIPGKQDWINDDIVWCVHEDPEGILWVGTDRGGLNRFDPDREQFQHYMHDPEDLQSLSDNKILCIYPAEAGTLWIGTPGGLNRFDIQTGRCRRFTVQDGLPANAIHAILQDDEGALWIATPAGLSRFDTKKRQFKNYTIHDGLPSNEFSVNAALKSVTGEMGFGTIDGFTLFHPHEITGNPHIPPVVITDLRIYNQSVPVGVWHDGRTLLTRSITETDIIRLSHEDRVLSIEFAALDFSAPSKNQYACLLEGLDKAWNVVGNNHVATYTRLSPGQYTFFVKGSNNDGVWNDTAATLEIVVMPAFWQQPFPRFMVAGVVVIVILLAHRVRVREIKKRNLALEDINTKLNAEVKERQIAESKAQASLEEKEVLLKEIHHRVKNNMQVVCSLLSLQSHRIKDKALLQTFNESQSRVRAMALIHDRLYQSKDLVEVDFSDYVQDLVREIMTSFGLFTKHVHLKIEVDHVGLSINQAVPCGLVINELFTNAMKYAFPADRDEDNEIFIGMCRDEKTVHLEFYDNGIGMPDGFDYNSSASLGIRLVNVLIRQQLHGAVDYIIENGTRVLISFDYQ